MHLAAAAQGWSDRGWSWKETPRAKTDHSLPWPCSALALLLQVTIEEIGEWNKAEKQSKIQFSGVMKPVLVIEMDIIHLLNI